MVLPKLLFKVILTLFIVTSFLPVFKAINGTPNEIFYFYIICIILPIIQFKIVFSRFIMWFIVIIFLHLIYLMSGHYDLLDSRITETLFEYFSVLFFSYCVLESLTKNNDYLLSKRFFFYLILILLAITSTTSIIGLSFFPSAARDIIGNTDNQETRQILFLNIGSYAFQFFCVLITPIIYLFYNYTKQKFWLLFICLLTFSVFKAQIITFIIFQLISISLVVFSINKNKSIKKYFFRISFFLFFVWLMRSTIANIFSFLSNTFSDYEQVRLKFFEISNFLKGELSTNQHIEGYEDRFKISLQGFYNSPFFGGEDSGGHHFWIDMLAEHGLFTFVIFSFIFYKLLKKITFSLNKIEKIVYMQILVIFIILGIFKNILIYSMIFQVLVLCPYLILNYKVILKSKYD